MQKTFSLGAVMQVQPDPQGTLASLIATPDGGYEAAWSLYGVYDHFDFQQFDATGQPVGGPIESADQVVLRAGASYQLKLDDGTTLQGFTNTDRMPALRVLDANGQLLGAPIALPGDSWQPGWHIGLSQLPDRSIAVVWQGAAGSPLFTTVLHDSSPDVYAPTFTRLTLPGDGTAGARIELDVKFNESVQLGSAPITVRAADGTVVASYDGTHSAGVSIQKNHLHLQLPADATPGTRYSIEFADGSVVDASGNALAGMSLQFTTPGAEPAPAPAAAPLASGVAADAEVARLGDGTFEAVWLGIDGAVHAQHFDGGGHLLGGAITIANGATPTGVAGLTDGSFVVELQQVDGAAVSVTAQRVDASGQLAGAPVTVQTYAGPSVFTARLVGGAGIVALPGGGYVAQVLTDATGLKGYGALSQLLVSHAFDASGNPVGSASTYSNLAHFDSAVTATGGLVVADTDFVPAELNVYDAALKPLGTGYSPMLDTPPYDVSVATLANGNIVLAWQLPYWIEQPHQLQLQIFSPPAGGPAQPVTPVMTLVGDVGTTPDLIALADGGFLLTWSGQFAQAFDASGNAASDVMQIGSQDVVASPDGGFVVVSQQGSGLVEQKYSLAVAPAPAPGAQGTTGDDTLVGTAGNDRLDGLSGNDRLDGGAGTDAAVIETSLAGVLSYSIGSGVATLTTTLGTATLLNIERVQFADALFALDTNPGGHAWQAAALFHAGFGVLPGRAELSHWTAQADGSSSMGELGQHMIDFYAPGVSSHDLVASLYQQLTHQAASADTIQGYVDQIGAGRTFATQGELLAYAANLSLNTDGLAGLVGSVQQLDPAAF
jgi:hypothetical protein